MITWIKAFWTKYFGTGTPDDIRNPFWRVTEALTVKVEWHKYLIDLRLFFKRDGKWHYYLALWKPVKQNFWNGIFTFNIYIIKTTIKGYPMIIPRFDLVFRPLKNWYLEIGCGYLFDRGEFGLKCAVYNQESCDAIGWEEGSV